MDVASPGAGTSRETTPLTQRGSSVASTNRDVMGAAVTQTREQMVKAGETKTVEQAQRRLERAQLVVKGQDYTLRILSNALLHLALDLDGKKTTQEGIRAVAIMIDTQVDNIQSERIVQQVQRDTEDYWNQVIPDIAHFLKDELTNVMNEAAAEWKDRMQTEEFYMATSAESLKKAAEEVSAVAF